MATLPVPASQFFADFAFEVEMYNTNSGQIQGMPSNEKHDHYIAFLYPATINNGDIITSLSGKSYVIQRTELDHYNGKPEMIKAYY